MKGVPVNSVLLALLISTAVAQRPVGGSGTKGNVTIPDGPRGIQVQPTSNSQLCGNVRCHDVTLKNLVVSIGKDGTDDDVQVKVCSFDGKTCCTTPALKSLLSDDWSSNDKETWSGKKLGECRNKTLKASQGLQLTLSKKGKDTLGVGNLTVEVDTKDEKNKTVQESFQCGAFAIGGNRTLQTKNCNTTRPPVIEEIDSIKVTIGADGTDDSVKIDICSDDEKFCCRTPLQSKGVSSLLTDDWSRNDVEIWKSADLDKCQKALYKFSSTGGPKFSLIKNGKDDLLVTKVVLNSKTIYGDKKSYDCGDYKLVGDCTKNGFGCTQSRICKPLKN